MDAAADATAADAAASAAAVTAAIAAEAVGEEGAGCKWELGCWLERERRVAVEKEAGRERFSPVRDEEEEEEEEEDVE